MKLYNTKNLSQMMKSKNFLQYSFLTVINKVRSYEKQELKKNKLKITPKELSYLSLISEMGKEKQQKLLDFFDVSKGTMSNMIKLLIKKKLVVQERSEKDKRVKYLKLTLEGKEIIKINDKIRSDIKDYLKERLSENEFDQFIKLTLKLT